MDVEQWIFKNVEMEAVRELIQMEISRCRYIQETAKKKSTKDKYKDREYELKCDLARINKSF